MFRSIAKLSPDWSKILKQISDKRTNPEEVRTLGHILQEYYVACRQISGIDNRFITPYYVAVFNGNFSHVLFLWAFIKDKNPPIEKYKDTLLHAVAERGHSSIFKLILNEVVNKNPKGRFADTPLHHAAEYGHIGKILKN